MQITTTVKLGRELRFIFLELSAVSDNDLLGRLAGLRSEGLDFLDGVHASDNTPKYDVLAIEPRCLGRGQKKLRPVGVAARVGHRQGAGCRVLEGEVLVVELGAVDGLASGTVVVGEVSALAHEVRDDAVEGGVLEAETFLARAERPEVFGCPGDHVGAQFHGNATQGLSVGFDVEEHFRIRHDSQLERLFGDERFTLA